MAAGIASSCSPPGHHRPARHMASDAIMISTDESTVMNWGLVIKTVSEAISKTVAAPETNQMPTQQTREPTRTYVHSKRHISEI